MWGCSGHYLHILKMQQKGMKACVWNRLENETAFLGLQNERRQRRALMYYWNYSAARTRVCKRLKRKFAAAASVNVRRGSFKDLYRVSGTPAPPSPSEADEVASDISSVIYVGCGLQWLKLVSTDAGVTHETREKYGHFNPPWAGLAVRISDL